VSVDKTDTAGEKMGQNHNRLRAEERNFLIRVKKAIFSNPFSDERLDIDRTILGDLPQAVSDGGNRDKLLAQKVTDKLGRIIGNRRHVVQEFGGQDKKLLEYGILFSIYHSFCDDLDILIKEQLAAGQSLCKVKFATDCLGQITEKGVDTHEAERFFGLFFQLRRTFYFIDLIVGSSPCVKRLRLDLWNNVFTHDIGLYEQYLWNRMEDFSTILLGETGTGKGMAATAIGRSGFIPWDNKKGCFKESFTKAFTALNLSQFPEELLESELFGHQKGAFTGAIDNHEGLFAHCSPFGAIFLDEIGEVSLPVQIKLLNILQERLFSPVGSHRLQRFQGRVIAATNQNLQGLRETGKFRDDFYYRLCSDSIHVPPLRQRLQEDPAELQRLLSRTVERILGSSSQDLVNFINESICKSLPADYHWPGNIRELEQCTRRILLKRSYEGDMINRDCDDSGQFIQAVKQGNFTARELLSGYCRQLHRRLGSYDAVSKRVGLDWRTVKKHVES
jgi:hypothetical protein